ncbi:hypothetical protein SAMN05443245_5869 [Paraburkholderia fungorum]|uniref:Uncharacterized protein n=1 Tax=Paraburkholderia fungorum TaxID=134537 RepID=A0A1H1IYA6_9BURK|nr:hypothetical protein [Paraburkholderia fungorum]SDR42639.1 hypothetical protein SAMN05443245_5869 [Paraburkholderia fungorum]
MSEQDKMTEQERHEELENRIREKHRAAMTGMLRQKEKDQFETTLIQIISDAKEARDAIRKVNAMVHYHLPGTPTAMLLNAEASLGTAFGLLVQLLNQSLNPEAPKAAE